MFVIFTQLSPLDDQCLINWIWNWLFAWTFNVQDVLSYYLKIFEKDVSAVVHYQSSKGVHKVVEEKELVTNENGGVILQSAKYLQPLQ